MRRVVVRTFSEAVEALGQPGARPIAGGTDLLVKMRRGGSAEVLVDLHGVEDSGAREVRIEGDQVVAGALVTFEQLARDPIVGRTLPALQQAAGVMGSLQIRGRGTLGGNVANASPAGDAIPGLLVAPATARVLGPGGPREIPIDRVFLGPGRTVLAPDEVFVAFSWPVSAAPSAFERVGSRAYHIITKASVAVSARVEAGLLRDVRVGLGAVAPVPLRARTAEAALEGQAPTHERFVAAAEIAAAEATPIDDVRSTAGYRAEMCRVLVPRLLGRVLG